MMHGRKQYLIVANWKLHPPTVREAEALYIATARSARAVKGAQVIVAPPAIHIPVLAGLHIRTLPLAAQDAFWANEGAYTGELGPRMLHNAGARYAIVGHSERRQHSGDTEEVIAKKLKTVLTSGLKAILCVGELERKTDGGSMAYVKHQLTSALKGLGKGSAQKLTVAYEPVWAISSQHTGPDTPEGTLEMAIYIRRVLHDCFGKDASRIPVLYGGSVVAQNVGMFLSRGGVDGLLVGGASRNATHFARILKVVSSLS